MSLTKEQILYFIENPLELNDQTLVDLKGIVEEFPYFQSAHLLYASNLLHENNYRFEAQLKFAAAHVNDRSVLYHLLNDYEILKEKESKSDNSSLASGSEEIESSFSGDELIELDEEHEEDARSREVSSVERDSVLPIESQPYILEDGDELDNKGEIDLIERFISNKPTISPLDPDFKKGHDISEGSAEDDEEFMTETLARIYVKQGYYQKAINAFKKLSLKYPEKSTYFAGQIDEVNKLLNK
jgi:tetratricopeptide (TPR) repeat protein